MPLNFSNAITLDFNQSLNSNCRIEKKNSCALLNGATFGDVNVLFFFNKKGGANSITNNYIVSTVWIASTQTSDDSFANLNERRLMCGGLHLFHQ